jgi:hypothetical protein
MNQNGFIIREGSEADFNKTAELLFRHDFAPGHLNWTRADYLDWLRWKFLDNPDGPARMFVVEDSHGAIVGLRVGLPRWLSSAETGKFKTYHAVDDFIDGELRERGLYSKLRQFATDRLPNIFGYSSDIILRIAIREGYRILGPAQKWRFPIAVAQRIANGPYSFVAPLVDMLLRFYTSFWLGKCPVNLQMRPITRFNRDFDIDSKHIHGIRSAAYLNWRFIDNRMYSYSVFEFFEDNASIGYCVYAEKRSKAEIYDFVVSRRHRGCLRLLVEHCRGEGIHQLTFRGFELHLGKFGFICRRDSHSNCIVSPDLPGGRWMLTLGDRDY